MCEQNQEKFDKECPPDFQSATYVAAYGQLDMILEPTQNLQNVVGEIAALLTCANKVITSNPLTEELTPTEEDMNAPFNYTRSRSINRPQVSQLSSSFIHSLTHSLVFIHSLTHLSSQFLHRLKTSFIQSSLTSLSCTVMERLEEINVFEEELLRSLPLTPPILTLKPFLWLSLQLSKDTLTKICWKVTTECLLLTDTVLHFV